MRTGAAALILLILLPVGDALALRGAAYRGAGSPPRPEPSGRVIDDRRAYWTYFFETGKEWILADRLRSARERRKDPAALRARIVPVLREAVVAKSASVRDAAVIALGRAGGEEVVEPVAKRLPDVDRVVAGDAALALGLTGSPKAAGPLRALLDDRELAPWAALGLALLGDRDSLPALTERFDPRAKGFAAPRACCIATAIGFLGDETAIGALSEPLGRTRSYDRLEVHACSALSRIGGTKSLRGLLRAAQDPDPAVRGAAALALGSFPSRTTIRFLEQKGLRAGDRMQRLFSLWSLAALGRGEALKPIAEAPPKDQHAAQHAALALAAYGRRDAADSCAKALAHDGATVPHRTNRSAAAMALGLLRDPRTCDLVEPLLLDARRDADTRGYYAFALGLCGDPRARGAILAAMAGDAPPDLLRSAGGALGLIGDPEDVPRLLRLLRGEGPDDRHVRGAAAIGLGRVGHESAVEPLIGLARKHEEPWTRAIAVAALGRLADRDDAPRIPLLFERFHYRITIPVVEGGPLDPVSRSGAVSPGPGGTPAGARRPRRPSG